MWPALRGGESRRPEALASMQQPNCSSPVAATIASAQCNSQQAAAGSQAARQPGNYLDAAYAQGLQPARSAAPGV